jgi:hypothetical protein
MNSSRSIRPTPTSVLARAVRLALLLGCVAGLPGCYSDDYHHDYEPCCAPPPPPPGGPYQVTLAGIDALDGFVEPNGWVHGSEGLQTTDAGTVAFESFDLSSVPLNARVGWAELVINNAWWTSLGGPIELDVSTVPYGDTLDSADPSVQGYDTVAFSLGAGAQGAAVALDVSSLVAAEVQYGSPLFQIRLDSFGGDLGFEDAGGNLGLGFALAPVLTVSYD